MLNEVWNQSIGELRGVWGSSHHEVQVEFLSMVSEVPETL